MAGVRISITDKLEPLFALDARLFPEDAAPSPDGVWFAGRSKGELSCYASYVLKDMGTRAALLRSGVSPTFQGYGFQKRLIKARCLHAKLAGAIWATSYVACDNTASLCSLLACGFKPYDPELRFADPGGWLYLRKRL